MSVIEDLLSRRYIVREFDHDLYYRTKDNIKDIQKVMRDKFGYMIIVNQHIIKLEKIPSKAEPWMGIQEFTSIKEYQMFCFILMFLEDKEREEQFVLSTLTEYIQGQFQEGEIDWTHFTTRRQLIRVIKYCIHNKLLRNNDGDEDQFSQDYHSEVLYENTGVSRYFLRSFATDIMDYQTPQDFEKSEWIDMDEDRGIIRRQRVYRRLLLSLGMARDQESEEDFLYLRNYRYQISSDFSSYFPCYLDLYQSSAYLVLEDHCSMGKTFPANNALHDLIMIVHYTLHEKVLKEELKINQNEQILLLPELFSSLMKMIISNNLNLLPKKYQDISLEQLSHEIIEEMVLLGLTEIYNEIMIIHPICGKLNGKYT